MSFHPLTPGQRAGLIPKTEQQRIMRSIEHVAATEEEDATYATISSTASTIPQVHHKP